MSLDVVILSARTCSGLAYSGVRRRASRPVTSAVREETSALRIFASPKSRSFGTPESVTKMFPGLRSRWTTRLRCAYETAPQTSRKSLRRSATGSRRASHQARRSLPSMNSIAKYGSPSAVVPPSWRRAMLGWSRPARIWRSLRKRRRMNSVSIPRFTILSATCRWYASSERAAR